MITWGGGREIWFLFAGLVAPDNPVLLTLKRELFDPLNQLRHLKQLGRWNLQGLTGTKSAGIFNPIELYELLHGGMVFLGNRA